MRSQPSTDESWTEAEAMRLVRSLSDSRRRLGHNNDSEQRRQDVLTRTVQDEVIPRLLMARRPQAVVRSPADTPARAANAEQVARLVAMALSGNQTELAAYVEAMHDAGTPAESLFLDLLTPTARRLGEMWEDDTCTFSDVTMGLLRLGNVLRLLSRAFDGEFDPGSAGPSALLVQMPGEQHGFGLAMVVQFFRRAGWNVRQEPVTTNAELVELVRAQWFGIVGISVACNERLEALAEVIRSIRKHARNRAIGVMVGGPPFLTHPQLALMVGADATAVDGRLAAQQAQSLLSLLAGER